ncbi:hypothetical protein CRYUN_Cryun24cG0111700 [Craigia yunnanensis]
MIGFGVPTESDQITQRTLPEAAIGPPYFYYENVALAPKGVWSTISRFLYDVEPEFVDSKYFCASARKRGYIHNLPIENRERKIDGRIRKALEDYDDEPPLSVQIAFHLSVLKDMFPGGINLLSLFSGIGGAEVALLQVGIPLKNVVSVKKSEVNRNIVKSWWEQTNHRGTLIDMPDVQELNGDRLEQLMNRFGGFDLLVDGSPCNNLAGSNRHHRDGLEGEANLSWKAKLVAFLGSSIAVFHIFTNTSNWTLYGLGLNKETRFRACSTVRCDGASQPQRRPKRHDLFLIVPFGIFGACRFLVVAFLAMAATATASSAGPRYAPPDPTLPKPWKGLVDGKTGYLYIWNPVTNVSQYERPTSVDSVPKSYSSVPINSSVQVQQSSEGRRGYSPDKENDRYGRGSNAVSKLESVSRSNQNARGGPIHSYNTPNGTSSSVIGGYFARGHVSVAGETPHPWLFPCCVLPTTAQASSHHTAPGTPAALHLHRSSPGQTSCSASPLACDPKRAPAMAATLLHASNNQPQFDLLLSLPHDCMHAHLQRPSPTPVATPPMS